MHQKKITLFTKQIQKSSKLVVLASILMFLFSCKEYENQLIKIDIVNKLQECEEHNMHYSIISVDDTIYSYLKGKVILPIIDKRIASEDNNELFFPAKMIERVKITVLGKYSKRPKKDKEGLSSCLGAHKFLVSEILKSEIVTLKMDYPISN